MDKIIKSKKLNIERGQQFVSKGSYTLPTTEIQVVKLGTICRITNIDEAEKYDDSKITIVNVSPSTITSTIPIVMSLVDFHSIWTGTKLED